MCGRPIRLSMMQIRWERCHALIMEDGGALFDSRVIVEYLDTLTPVAKLIPPNGRERAEVRTWEALADGVMDASILVRLEQTQRPAEQQSAEVDRSADEQGRCRCRIDGSRPGG